MCLVDKPRNHTDSYSSRDVSKRHSVNIDVWFRRHLPYPVSNYLETVGYKYSTLDILLDLPPPPPAPL